MFFTLFVGFFLGVLAVAAVEGLLLYWVIQWLARKKGGEPKGAVVVRDPPVEKQPLTYPYEKQGVVWVLEQDKFPKSSQNDPQTKVPKEQKNKREILEVFPVKRNAKIKDHSLILIDLDGLHMAIQLLDCTIVAVSGSNLYTRKWMKKYPIRIENKSKAIYNGSKVFYLYLETSWEKESWCKALRLASCSTEEKLNWYSQLNEEFHDYLVSLTAEYPLFQKSSAGSSETTGKSIKIDASSSKVRHLLKKFAKKASRIGIESKPSAVLSSSRGDKKVGDKLQSYQDALPANGSVKSTSTEKSSLQDMVQPTSPATTLTGNQQVPASSDAVSDEKVGFDEGVLCWNLLFSRLFFDAKRSTEMNSLIKERIQRTLSNMRTPGYIGGITCNGLDLGRLPPYIHSIKALPMDMNEAWAVEVEIEYSGSLLLDIETRLEVREPEFQKGITETSLEPSSSGEVTADLLEGLESYSNQLNLSTNLVNGTADEQDEGDQPDGLTQSRSGSWTSTYMSRWKTILNSIADQVSQVPLSLTVKVASLRGILRLHVKPPPSDQLWIGFTSMPDIDLILDSSVGERKIASTHVALLIGNRFKTAIRESLVLPNCESICIPWMLAEKDDWVPRSLAPFIWIPRSPDSNDLLGRDASNSQPGESKTKPDSNKGNKTSSSNSLENNDEKTKGVVSGQPSVKAPTLDSVSSEIGLTTSVSLDQSAREDLRVPLLRNDEKVDNGNLSRADSPESSLMTTLSVYEKTTEPSDEDMKPKKIGRRERMRDLGKKMGEKLEEKRRHIEERGRHIVEKMRENARTTEGSGSFKL